MHLSLLLAPLFAVSCLAGFEEAFEIDPSCSDRGLDSYHEQVGAETLERLMTLTTEFAYQEMGDERWQEMDPDAGNDMDFEAYVMVKNYVEEHPARANEKHNAENALRVQTSTQEGTAGLYLGRENARRLRFTYDHVFDLAVDLEADIKLPEDVNEPKKRKDLLACSQSTYTKVATAAQIIPEAPMVLTPLGHAKGTWLPIRGHAWQT